jgi:hypothetical protein
MKMIFAVTIALFSWSALGGSTTLPLHFDKALVEQRFVSPVMSAQINGESGLFLIDSGAQLTVVSRWFSERAKIRSNESGSVGGTTGESSKSPVANVNLIMKSIDGTTLTFEKQNVLIVDLPDVFKVNKIVGIISPQQLLRENQFGTLDLSDNPFFKIEDDPPQQIARAFALGTSFSEGPEGHQTVLFTLDAVVDNYRASFIVDTGAEGAGFGIKTAVGQKLLPRSIPTKEKVGGITGKPEVIRIVPNAHVKILDRNVNMRIRLQPSGKNMAADGMLGMQFLKNCALFLSLKSGSISCP